MAGLVSALAFALLLIAAPVAFGDEVVPSPQPPGDVQPPPPDPAPTPDPTPPPPAPEPPIANPDPQPPPPDPAPASDPTPPPPSGQSPSDPSSGAGASDSFTRAGNDAQSGAALSGSAGHAGTQTNSTTETPKIAPGVDDFDDFGPTDSGGSQLQLPTGGASVCGIACASASGGLLSRVVSSSELQQREQIERKRSRTEGLPMAMDPGAPHQFPGRAFSLPGSGGGAGVAFVLLSLIAILCAAHRRVEWTTSFRLPTATWRLSGYVPPIESPG